MSAVAYARLPTERRHPRSRALDRLSVPQLLHLMNREDARVSQAVSRVIPQARRAVGLIVERLRAGGRLVFVGAGTSGRLGVMEAAECRPTFNTPPTMVQAMIAGGRAAVFRSREGAEDDRQAARRAIERRVRSGDVVVGIAASGITPFVAEGLRVAKARGASTILVTCHGASALRLSVDVVIAPQVGPEILTGSTRLKAGTATKLVLNMLTLAAMVRLGKVHGNLMVDVRPTSRKLRARARRIIQALAGVSEQEAARLLRRARGQVKAAIVMAAKQVDLPTAQRLLARHGGILRHVLGVRHVPV